MALEYLDVMARQQPREIVARHFSDALDLLDHVPRVALQVAGRPHPLGAEIGVADVARQREGTTRGLDLEPLDAETVGVAGEAAGDAVAELMIAVEEDDAALLDRSIERAEIAFI